MIGLYFSGTGNTRHCINVFLKACDPNAKSYSIEQPEVLDHLLNEDTIVLAYPIYYSNIPKIMADFLKQQQSAFDKKQIFIIATMGLFSGDGCGCSARLLKRYGAHIIGGVHIKMPDCIGDEKALKRTLAKNKELVFAADKKLQAAAMQWKQGKAPQEGLRFWHHCAGLFGQRLWFYTKTSHYCKKLSIKEDVCIGCGTCVALCPMNNLHLLRGKAAAGDACTMCYRCVNTCPQQAITLLGKNVYEQSRIEKYL